VSWRPFKTIFDCFRFRNIVVTTLLDQLWANEPRLTKDLKPILRELTNLVRGETSTVSLKARYKSCKLSIVVKNPFGIF
jgi:hypothetical protein